MGRKSRLKRERRQQHLYNIQHGLPDYVPPSGAAAVEQDDPPDNDRLGSHDPYDGASPEFAEAAFRQENRLAGEDSILTLTSRDFGLPKLSARIIELAQAMVEGNLDNKEYSKAIDIAVVAWNVSVQLDEGDDRALEVLLETSRQGEQGAIGATLVAAMAVRKKEMFPDDHRLVADYQISFTHSGVNLSVISSMRTEDVEPIRQAM